MLVWFIPTILLNVRALPADRSVFLTLLVISTVAIGHETD